MLYVYMYVTKDKISISNETLQAFIAQLRLPVWP